MDLLSHCSFETIFVLTPMTYIVDLDAYELCPGDGIVFTTI